MDEIDAGPTSIRQLQRARLVTDAADPGRSALVRLRHGLEYAGLRAVDWLYRALPLEFAARLNGGLWSAIARHSSRHRRAARNLAAMMPELSAQRREAILRAMWRHLGATFLEGLQLDRLAAEPERIELDETTQTILRRTVAEGAIIVCPHLGNWEASVLPLAAVSAQHMGVYRRAQNPLIDAYLYAIRKTYFGGGLLAKGDAAARGLLRQARQGRSLGFMADLRDINGVAVAFFGRPAPSTPLPAALARQYGRPIFAVCLVRLAPARYRLEAVEIPVARGGDREGDISATTARVQQAFEAWIRQWPEQWMWAHERYMPKTGDDKRRGVGARRDR